MYKKVWKGVFGRFLAILLLPFWCIVLIIVGLCIYLEDQGPIFYNAPRLGKNGKIFRMYKFRSMKVNAPDIRNEDGSTFNSEEDPRLTRVGCFLRKTSIDETPQLINIIRGDMSFVGPRPDLPEHVHQYVGNEKRKLEVKPGVTGYNQAYFRNSIPWKERIQHDVYYVEHVSFKLDVQIIFRTIASVLKAEDIYIAN